MDQLDYIVVASVACGLFALGSAAFVYRKAKDPRVAGRLALLLVLETIMLWTSLGGPIRWIEPGGVDRFWLRLHFANDGFLIAAYLPAVAVLVPSRLVAPFKSNRAAIAMIALALINAFCVFAFPDFYLPDGEKATRALDVLLDIGPGVAAIYGLLVLSYALGLIATLSARRVAQGPLARRQANALAFAFGARDSSWGLIYIMGLVIMLGGATLIPQPEPGTMSLWLPGLCIGGLTIYVCLLAYGVVSTKLFDIDLRVKWTLERGTIAAIFIAVFFMVSEGTAAILSEQLGNMIGILATGALVFAMAPLQRAAERLSNQAMPSVQDTPEYKNFRKLQVYGEAVAEAMREGAVSPVQRVVLSRLRQQLELDEEEAAALEQEIIVS